LLFPVWKSYTLKTPITLHFSTMNVTIVKLCVMIVSNSSGENMCQHVYEWNSCKYAITVLPRYVFCLIILNVSMSRLFQKSSLYGCSKFRQLYLCSFCATVFPVCILLTQPPWYFTQH
jgi:hypothetical protein